MLSLTLGLGVWQVQRLAWKSDLLANIDRGEAAAPVPLTAQPIPFHRYRVTGQFAKEQAWYGAEVRQGPSGPVLGEHVIGILLRPDEPPLVVDRGWAADGPAPRPPADPVTIEGYIRLPEHTMWMGAADDPLQRRFYALDPATIAASLGYAAAAPFTLVAMGPSGAIPDPVQALPRPPNDHLSYAVTWFSLSAALVVVFLVYARQAIRQGRTE
jgi:surfeit locus 1 family protein